MIQTKASILTRGLITKDQLSLINRQNFRYPLAVAEKDYFLAIASKIIHDSVLKDKLVFKGGTALYHVYLPQLRFSEDLDFSTNAVKISLAEVKNIFSQFDFFTLKKYHLSPATIKIERLLYLGPLNQSNSLKIEIDFFQNVVLPPLELDYQNVYGVKTKVRVMDLKEIAAEKIRAMSDRARFRDFYDFMMIRQKMTLDFKEVLEIIKQKEIRRTITMDNILNNWRLAKQENQDQFSNIFYTEKLKDDEVEEELMRLVFKEIKRK